MSGNRDDGMAELDGRSPMAESIELRGQADPRHDGVWRVSPRGTWKLEPDGCFPLVDGYFVTAQVAAALLLGWLDKLLTIVSVDRAADPRPSLPTKCAGCGQHFCACGKGSAGEGW